MTTIDKQELTQRLDRLDTLFRDDDSEALKEYKQWVRDIIRLCASEKVGAVEEADAIKALKTIQNYCEHIPIAKCNKDCVIKGWCNNFKTEDLPMNWGIDTWIKKE